jgi:drug/metabolite transporter (DMT)-like permease
MGPTACRIAAEVRTDRLKGVALILSGSALWGASGTLTKLLKAHGFAIYDILAWRYFISFLALAALASVFFQAPSLRRDLGTLRPAALLALCTFGMSGAFTWSNFFTTVANAIALSYTAPLFAALLAWVVLGEAVRGPHRLAVAIGMGGVAVFAAGATGPAAATPTALSPNVPLGNLLALLSGLLFGCYLVFARMTAQRHGAMLITTIWQFLTLSILTLPALPFTLFKGISASGYLILGVYATLCTAAPILLLNLAGLFLKAHESSVLALSEIPFAILIGMATLGEYPSLTSWIGVALILVAGGLASVPHTG